MKRTPPRSVPVRRSVLPPRARRCEAQRRMHLTLVSFGLATYMAPPPPDSAAAPTGAATATQAHRAAPIARRRSWKRTNTLFRPLFLRPTGLAVGLAPKERRYGRRAEAPFRFAPSVALPGAPNGSPAP